MTDMNKDNLPEEVMELSLDDLEEVSGGGYLQDLVNQIRNSGKADELKKLLKEQGKAVAAAKCCEYFAPICGFCATAISML